MLYFNLMSKDILSEYKNQKWILGVSGGPDSMALLDMAYHAGAACYVVHVNYHKRDSALRDQKIVEDYCLKHKIECSVYNAPDFSKGNFQEKARSFRYQKMIEVLRNVGADAMVVAHHKDDDLETYLFQKSRSSQVDYYGLKSEIIFKKHRLIRPLLDLTKNELIDYCELNHIEYGIDESNEDLRYTRNKIRKELKALSTKELEVLFLEKTIKNQEQANYLNSQKQLLEDHIIELKVFNNLANQKKFLLNWLKEHHVNKALSYAFLQELLRQISEVSSFVMECGDLRIVKQYEKISLLSKEIKHYSYTIENTEDRVFEEFTLDFTKNGQIHINLSDFPLTIKSCEGNEIIGNIRLNRWFIKHKIPLEKRELWPVIYNSNGKLLYIVNRSFLGGVNPNKITLTVVK